MNTQANKDLNDFILEKTKKDIRDIIKYSELSLKDIRDLKIDNCINSDMDRIIGIAHDVKRYIKFITNNE